MLSGALARAGRNVLHVDARTEYGADDASVPLDALAARLVDPPAAADDNVEPDALPLRSAVSGGAVRTRRSLDARVARRSVVDLWPRALFARSPAVALLVRAGVNRYVEFKWFVF